MKAATSLIMMLTFDNVTISIHAAREGGDAVRYESVKIKNISIHAAREGGDLSSEVSRYNFKYFNPRRP